MNTKSIHPIEFKVVTRPCSPPNHPRDYHLVWILTRTTGTEQWVDHQSNFPMQSVPKEAVDELIERLQPEEIKHLKYGDKRDF